MISFLWSWLHTQCSKNMIPESQNITKILFSFSFIIFDMIKHLVTLFINKRFAWINIFKKLYLLIIQKRTVFYRSDDFVYVNIKLYWQMFSKRLCSFEKMVTLTLSFLDTPLYLFIIYSFQLFYTWVRVELLQQTNFFILI